MPITCGGGSSGALRFKTLVALLPSPCDLSKIPGVISGGMVGNVVYTRLSCAAL